MESDFVAPDESVVLVANQAPVNQEGSDFVAADESSLIENVKTDAKPSDAPLKQ